MTDVFCCGELWTFYFPNICTCQDVLIYNCTCTFISVQNLCIFVVFTRNISTIYWQLTANYFTYWNSSLSLWMFHFCCQHLTEWQPPPMRSLNMTIRVNWTHFSPDWSRVSSLVNGKLSDCCCTFLRKGKMRFWHNIHVASQNWEVIAEVTVGNQGDMHFVMLMPGNCFDLLLSTLVFVCSGSLE